MTDDRSEKLARAMSVARFGDEKAVNVPGFRYWAIKALAAIDADPEAYGYHKVRPRAETVWVPIKGTAS